jgi:transposase
MCVYARELTALEGKRIQQILRKSTNRTAIRRAQVIVMSAQGYRATEISKNTYLHVVYVRELIGRFNNEGIELFKEKKRPGRTARFTDEIKAEIVEYALSPPKLLGEPYTVWSLEKLRNYLMKIRVVKTISIEKLRVILKENKVSLQRTKTWKESNDPDFESKKNG